MWFTSDTGPYPIHRPLSSLRPSLPHALLSLSPLFLQLSLSLSSHMFKVAPSATVSLHTQRRCVRLAFSWGCRGTQGSVCVGFRVLSSCMVSRDLSRSAERLGTVACLSHKLTVLKNTSPFLGPRVLKQGVSSFELCLYI